MCKIISQYIWKMELKDIYFNVKILSYADLQPFDGKHIFLETT